MGCVQKYGAPQCEVGLCACVSVDCVRSGYRGEKYNIERNTALGVQIVKETERQEKCEKLVNRRTYQQVENLIGRGNNYNNHKS